ncbi:hypothetical protein [Streptomyces sp. NPDC047972]|uniref:hypothetical protein n=1 Tax=Streptomyces sp. NPDC047972 TaxID=3365493 RepID=UPI003723D29C
MTATPDRPGIDHLRQRVARAIHRYDNQHALAGNDIPSKHHHGEADAVLAELERELSAFVEYENAINWHTTCLACARVLDSCLRETERAERAEATLTAVRKLAQQWQSGMRPGESHPAARAGLDLLAQHGRTPKETT